MKRSIVTTLALLLLVTFSSNAQYEDHRIVGSYYVFEAGSTEYLYGDNVVLRAEPSSSSEALDTLKIGSAVEIIHRIDEISTLNGLEWNWYQVKVGRKTGYVLGGLIALDRVQFGDAVYLVTMAGVEQSSGDWEYTDYRVRTRVLMSNGDYYGHESKLNTNSFYLEVMGNRGVEGIEDIVVINLFAEACGVDGGKIYLFNNGNRLIEALRLSDVSEAGAFWFTESVIFPEDDGGWGITRYKREYGEPMDEEYGWSRSTVNTLILRWEDDHFIPNIEEFEFGDD